MPVEYISLLVLSLLFSVAWAPVSFGKKQAFGFRWLASNRKAIPKGELPEWAARCDRAFNNLKDNFPPFIAAVLVLGVLNKFDQSTSIAATIFVVARLCHYISYGAGNVPLRATFFFSGLIANTYLLIKALI
jgi:uncharacterized MAPEG superfamily protein